MLCNKAQNKHNIVKNTLKCFKLNFELVFC